MRPGQLSQRLRIAPRSTTEVVDALVERGLVERHADPDDRRATLVTPTPAGVRLGRDVGEARRTEAERLFSELSTRDRADLARILRKLRD
jgi:DNA-binding MarR family transcriptional regulator